MLLRSAIENSTASWCDRGVTSTLSPVGQGRRYGRGADLENARAALDRSAGSPAGARDELSKWRPIWSTPC